MLTTTALVADTLVEAGQDVGYLVGGVPLSSGRGSHLGAAEEFRVSGEAVLAKVKELVREGNVRRITIKNDEGRTLIEIPLTIGVIGTVLLPVWAAIGAIAALVANLTIAVERREPRGSDAEPADVLQDSGS